MSEPGTARRVRLLTRRGGTYLRVCDPEWGDCAETSYSKIVGGRWNPPGEFGALYLNQTVAVAAARARQNFAGEALSLFDLADEFRPVLQEFAVPMDDYVDVVSDAGIAALGLPATYPAAVPHSTCQPIAREAYAAGEPGVACRSEAECGVDGSWIGEELAVFDRVHPAAGGRRRFAEWYPGADAARAHGRRQPDG